MDLWKASLSIFHYFQWQLVVFMFLTTVMQSIISCDSYIAKCATTGINVTLKCELQQRNPSLECYSVRSFVHISERVLDLYLKSCLNPADLDPFFKLTQFASTLCEICIRTQLIVCFVFVFKVGNIIFYLTNNLP